VLTGISRERGTMRKLLFTGLIKIYFDCTMLIFIFKDDKNQVSA
jgi:hypothetical protein